MFCLKLFGGACLEDEDGPLTGPAAQRHRLALLALLATSHPSGSSRDKLLAYLWPERDAEHARSLLKQAVHALRRALGEEALVSAGDELRLDTRALQCDVIAFEQALAAGERERAVELYAGPFLDGFFLRNAPEFERWLDTERGRLARAFTGALEELAEAATASGDTRAAVGWWRRLATGDPYSSRVTLRLMEALEAAGDRAGAIQQARAHTALLEQEFGAQPDPAVMTLAERIRTKPMLAPVPSGGRDRDGPDRAVVAPEPASPPEHPPPATVERGRPSWRTAALSAATVLAIAALLLVVWLLPETDARPGAAPDAAAASPRAIAVLPCANLSRDPEEEYFSDGLTEELIGTLSQVQALRVVARTSAFVFKGESRDIREIGRTLNVGTVLECSVRREGERIRVTAQLINAADGFHLWSQTYEREATDVFAIQSDLALQIASALEAELTPGERARLARRPTEDLEAYTLYLKGRYFWNQRTRGGLARSIEYFERAIEADPQFATAYAGLALVYAPLGVLGYVPPWEGRERMKEAALQAVALDPALAEAHVALGAYRLWHEWDFAAAEREYLRAIELDPGYPTGHMWYSIPLVFTGRLAEAVRAAGAAVKLDPLAPVTYVHLGVSLMFAGQTEPAIEQLRTAIELDSAYWMAHYTLGQVHESRGALQEALRAYEKAAALAGPTSVPGASVARLLARSGREAEARRILEELQAEAAETGVYQPMVASVFLALEDSNAALAWLDAAIQQRHPRVPLAVLGPGFATLRDDPRFLDLRRRIGLPQ